MSSGIAITTQDGKVVAIPRGIGNVVIHGVMDHKACAHIIPNLDIGNTGGGFVIPDMGGSWNPVLPIITSPPAPNPAGIGGDATHIIPYGHGCKGFIGRQNKGIRSSIRGFIIADHMPRVVAQLPIETISPALNRAIRLASTGAAATTHKHLSGP